jgi:hypothetical protein
MSPANLQNTAGMAAATEDPELDLVLLATSVLTNETSAAARRYTT